MVSLKHNSYGFIVQPTAPANSQQALQQLQQFKSQAQTPDQVFGQANQALGVDAAQQQVQGLRGAITRTTGLLNQVAPSVYGRTGNSLVTNAQATRQIGNEQAPIQSNLQDLGQQYGGASQDYQNLMSQAQQRASATLDNQNGQMSYLQQLYQNLYGQEQDAAKMAETKREFDADLAYKRAGQAGSGGLDLGALLGGGAGASGGASASSPMQNLAADIQRLIPKDYASKFGAGYTERQIERLKTAYPALKSQIANYVYDYRKQFEPQAKGGGLGQLLTGQSW